MTEFKIGDIVEVIEENSNPILLSSIGNVVDIKNQLIGVYFSDTEPYSYYFPPKCLALVERHERYQWFFFKDKSDIPTNPKCYETKEQAIQAGISYNLKHFYIGQILSVYPQLYAEDILDLLREDTEFLYGLDNYLYNVSEKDKEELEESLNDVLSEWFGKHRYFIDVVEEIEV